MALSTNNKLAVQTAAGQLYLFAAPTTFVGSTLAAKIKELFALLYTDGDKKQSLNPGLKPWAVLNAEGLSATLKQEPVQFDPAEGAPFTIGFQHLTAEAEITINDLTADKLQEILSNTANAQVKITAASGTPGQSINAHGGEVAPSLYTIIYRYPSREFPGQFDHALIPFGEFVLDGDYKLNKKDVRAMKVKVTATADQNLTNPDTGKPVYWIEHRTTAAPLA